MGDGAKLEQECALGLDVGGTKIAGGLVVWPTGEILCRRTLPTAANRGGEAVLHDVIALAHQLANEARKNSWQVIGAGLGVAELVDAAGRVTSAHTIQWEGLPISECLSDVAPAVVEADVRAAALGEAWFGAGRSFSSFAYVTVGTGISSCLVIDGKPWPGANGNALVMASSPLSASCGECGAQLAPILEEFASGPAITRRYREASGRAVTRAEEDVDRSRMRRTHGAHGDRHHDLPPADFRVHGRTFAGRLRPRHGRCRSERCRSELRTATTQDAADPQQDARGCGRAYRCSAGRLR
jgi:predicted NBD/HSP70 family sugar kinase